MIYDVGRKKKECCYQFAKASHLKESEGYFGDQSQGSSAVMPCGVGTTPTVQPAPYTKRGFENWRRELEMVPALECSIQNHDQGAVEIVE